MVQSPESAIEAVLNPNDLRASRGQAMVQFAAKRWFKSHAAANGERSVSGGLHETERSAVKEAWGYPSGGGRAQVGRSGRQAKRCPNTRAEELKKIPDLPFSDPYRRTVVWKSA